MLWQGQQQEVRTFLSCFDALFDPESQYPVANTALPSQTPFETMEEDFSLTWVLPAAISKQHLHPPPECPSSWAPLSQIHPPF